MCSSASLSMMSGNTCFQTLITSVCSRPLAPNGSSWDPAQARRMGTYTLRHLCVYLPPRGRGRSDSVYRCFRERLLRLGTRIMSPVRLPPVLLVADGVVSLTRLTCILNKFCQRLHSRRRYCALVLYVVQGLRDNPFQGPPVQARSSLLLVGSSSGGHSRHHCPCHPCYRPLANLLMPAIGKYISGIICQIL